MEKDQQLEQEQKQDRLSSDTIMFEPPEIMIPTTENVPGTAEDLAEGSDPSTDNSGEISEETATGSDSSKPAPRYAKAPVGEEEEATIVATPKRKKPTHWSVTWAVSKHVWRLGLGVALAMGILIMGLVGFLTVTEYTPAYAEAADRGSVNRSETITSHSLSILTLNTGYGALGADADFYQDGGQSVLPESAEIVEKNLEGIESILALGNADFIFLQEVDVGSQRSYDSNQWLKYEYDLENYESRFALNYSCEYVPYPVREPVGKIQSGLATYSSFDIVSATRYSQSNGYTWPRRVASRKPCLLVTRIPIDNSEQQLVLINVHMEDYEDEEIRKEQSRRLIELMEAEYAKGNFVIAGGDFSQNFPECHAYEVKDEDTDLWIPGRLDRPSEGLRYVYDDDNPTCRLLNQPYDPSSADTRYYVTDGFLVSANVTVDRVETLDYEFIYSDHNPVKMNFTLHLGE